MLRNLWCAETRLFLVLWLGLLWFGRMQFLFDPGVFWGTVVGQRILATAAVPRVDEFSFTFAGTPWQSHQWLAQVIMAGLHAVGGLDALVVATAGLLAATYAWAIGRLIRAGIHWSVIGLVFALLLLGSRYHWLARPQIATIAMFGWTVAQLVDFEAGKASWRRLCWLPPVFVAWANLHGGVLGGTCTVAFVVAGWCGQWLFGGSGPLKDRADVGRALLVAVGCGLAMIVNPYGWDLPLGGLQLMNLRSLPKYVYEHKPLDWENPHQQPILLFGLIYALVMATVPWRQWRTCWFVPVIWFVLSLQRIRHCTLFSIAATVTLAEMLPHSRLVGWAKKLGVDLVGPGPSPRGELSTWIVPVGVVAMALALQAASIRIPLVGAGYAQIDRALVPIELVGPIRELSQPNDRIFNEMAYGGFLIYYLPELRVTIDDRCELYGDDFITEQAELSEFFQRLRREGKDPAPFDGLDRWTDSKGIRLALVAKGQGMDYYFSHVPQRWTPVAETAGEMSPASIAGAVLYERKR